MAVVPSRLILRSGWEDRVPFVLRGLVDHTDQGVCLTDLQRRPIACNERFGHIFGLDTDALIASEDPHILRNFYQERLSNPQAWHDILDRIYGDPAMTHRDEIALVGPAQWVRRYAAPVYGEDHEPVARVWTFQDVTAERHERDLRDLLYSITIFADPQPSAALAYMAETIGRHYEATCVLSLLDAGELRHRSIGGAPTPLSAMMDAADEVAGNRLPIREGEPVLIRNMRTDPRTARLLPTRLGTSAYAGVPIIAASGPRSGEIIGSLGILSERMADAFGEKDLRFLTLAAARAGTELERENDLQRALAAPQSVVETQAADLAATREVLDAMVHALRLVSFEDSRENVLVAQAALLENLLGFGTAAILVAPAPGDESAYPAILATPYEHRRVERLDGLMSLREPMWLRRDLMKGLGLEEFPEALALPLTGQNRNYGALLFTSDRRLDLDEHRRTHLDALAEQISLTLDAYDFRTELVRIKEEIESTQGHAIETEKLASVGTLSAVIAHDIKNIVAAISIEVSTSTEPVRTLAAVRRHLDRFAVLSHRLLSYAKPRMVVKRRLDVDEVLARVTGLMSDTFAISDIQLVTTPPKSPNVVMGDPSQLEHLFTNILVNAVQAMSAVRGGLIEIRTKRTGRRIVIEFRDTGPGMKEETLDRAFEPFFSVRHEGFGLGLYAARRIAQEHGGDVKASSTLGVGTVLTVTLQAAPNDL